MIARAASLLGVAGTAALAGAAFHRGFTPGALVGPVLLAALVPVAAAALLARGNRRPPPLPVSILVSVLLWLAVVTATLFRHGSPHADGVLPAVGDGLVNGWARLLDVTLPAPDSPDLLVVPQVLTWLTALAGAELVTRTRAVVAPVAPALVTFGVAVALTVSGPGSDVGAAAGLVAAGGAVALSRRAEGRVWAAGRRPVPPAGTARIVGTAPPTRPAAHATGTAPAEAADRRAGGRVDARRTAVGLAVLVATIITALLAGPALPVLGGEPYDVRAHRGVPAYPQPTASPLDFVSAWLGSPDEVLFSVTPPVSRNIRLAVLDRFDGRQWTSSARYAPAGGRVPPDRNTRAPAGETRQDIEINTLPGAFLPHLDRPVRLSGAGLGVDVADGTLITTGPLVAARRYTVVSATAPDLPAAELAGLRAATGPQADAARALPAGLPAPIAEAARATGRGASTPFQQAYRLEQYLRSRLRYDPAAPAGHTYGHLVYFLGQSHTGTSEQFATLFAVLARVLGLPCRVVVGFRAPRSDGAADGAPAADVRAGAVRAGDVLAWPEIAFAGVGWVPFYPTPAAADTGGGQVATSAQGEPTGRAQRVAAAAAVPTAPTGAPPPVRPARAGRWPLVGAVVAGVVAAGGAAYLGLAVMAPVLRRRRRRTARDSRERVVGAWHDAIESLDRAGVPVPRTATPTEVVERGRAVVGVAGREPLADLATLASTALYAADTVGPGEADAAWRSGATLRAELRRATPVGRRARRRLAPGRLRGPVR
jgi:transglutaminase-like putative cysteine protease